MKTLSGERACGQQRPERFSSGASGDGHFKWTIGIGIQFLGDRWSDHGREV